MIPQFPIHETLPDLRSGLKRAPVVLLQAPPGAGKSTILPLELLDEPWLGDQKILILQPRRLAARAVATRMADLLGEPVGDTVGYRVRFETRVGKSTRIEVLTEGILTRMLQSDPALEGVGMVIFDEFHERSLNADLAWVLCKQVQDILREDLKILVMSATLDTGGLTAALGNPPLVESKGRQFPVEVRYLPQPAEMRIAAQMARAVRTALSETEGDILCFLPGAGEIHRTEAALLESGVEAQLHPLYGNLPFDQQRKAILPDPSGERKVVLATSIAETSLTIEGITVVIDSGFARVPRFDPRSGLTRLETVQVTRDAADQRAGRAGRLGPGICYRLWEAGAQGHLVAHRPPEILQADLSGVLLETAQWGVEDVFELNWPTPPQEGAVHQAKELLAELRAVITGKITEKGEEMLRMPTHPRLAHMLAEGKRLGLGALAADIAAILEEKDPLSRDTGKDLRLRLDALNRWRKKEPVNADRNVLKRIDRLARHWRSVLKEPHLPDRYGLYEPGRLTAFAYPGRVAMQMGRHKPIFKLSNGRRARLENHDTLITEEWLSIAQMDAGQQEGRIYLAAPIIPEELDELVAEESVLEWDEKAGELKAQVEMRVGNLAFASKALQDIPEEEVIPMVITAIRNDPSLLNWSDEIEDWQNRILSLRAWRPEESWPDVSREGLMASLEDWLGPFLGKVRRANDLKKLKLADYLQGVLPWELGSRLNHLAPTHLEVPTGSKIRLKYAADGSPPVLAVKLQEMFSCLQTPAVNDGRTPVMVHLLSPAMRPVQITQDMHGFWESSYADVRKDMRGRYPKHYWPEDPFTATPIRGVRPK